MEKGEIVVKNRKACIRFDAELMQKTKLYAVKNRMRQFKVVEQALIEFFQRNESQLT